MFIACHITETPHGPRPTDVPHKPGERGAIWTFGQMPESVEAFSENPQGKGDITAM